MTASVWIGIGSLETRKVVPRISLEIWDHNSMDPPGLQHSLDLCEEVWDRIPVTMLQDVGVINEVSTLVRNWDSFTQVVDQDFVVQCLELLEPRAVENNGRQASTKRIPLDARVYGPVNV